MSIGSHWFQALASEGREYVRPKGRHLFRLINDSSEPTHVDWRVDHDQMTLIVNHTPRIIARVQWIGVRTLVSNQWEWAWQMPTLQDDLIKDAIKTKQHGEAKLIDELTTATLLNADKLSHDLTCIAAMLCSGEAMWPLVRKQGVFEYVVMHEIRQFKDNAA